MQRGLAQSSNSGPVRGLRQGELDTMRVDLRVKSSEEKDIDSFIRDYKIGAAHKTIRTERKEKKQLQLEAAAARREKRAARIEEMDSRIKMQKKEDNRIRQKKTKVFRSTN